MLFRSIEKIEPEIIPVVTLPEIIIPIIKEKLTTEQRIELWERLVKPHIDEYYYKIN